MRTLAPELESALANGAGSPYFRAYIDDLIPNPSAPPDYIEGPYELPGLVYYKLERLTIEVHTKGNPLLNQHGQGAHREIRVERGVTVDGVEYGIFSNWYFITSHDYDSVQQTNVWKGHLLGDRRFTTAGDAITTDVIADVLSQVSGIYGQHTTQTLNLTAVYNFWEDWWQGLQFLPTGRTLSLHTASHLEALLKQKYAVLAFPADDDKVKFQASNYIGNHNGEIEDTDPFGGAGGFDFVTIDASRVLQSHNNPAYQPRSFFWRDEANSIHWLDNQTDTPHNLGFIPSTAAAVYVRKTTPPMPWAMITPPDLRVMGGDLVILPDGNNLEADPSEVFDVKHSPPWYQIIHQAQFIDNTEGGAMPSTIVAAAPYTPLDVSTFNGILDASDNNIQAAMQTIDDHTHTSSGAPMDPATATNDFLIGAQAAGVWTWVRQTFAATITLLRTSLDSIYAAASHNHDSDYADISEGVTNGDSHDHAGGDGAQINHTGLSNIGTNTHAQIDTYIGTTAPATFAPIAKGVTNGDTHDHSGGDGAQIDYNGLANLPTIPSEYYVMLGASAPFSPADGQTYYMGCFPSEVPGTTAANYPMAFPVAGTLRRTNVRWNTLGGVAGSNNAISIYLRINNTTSTLIATVSNTNALKSFLNTDINIAVSAGDYAEVEIVCPSWGTNPTLVKLAVQIVVQTA